MRWPTPRTTARSNGHRQEGFSSNITRRLTGQGFRASGVSGFPWTPQEAHREERCAQHAAHPKRLNARLCSPSVFSDVTERALSSVYDGRADVLVCVGAKVDCCLSELGLSDLCVGFRSCFGSGRREAIPYSEIVVA